MTTTTTKEHEKHREEKPKLQHKRWARALHRGTEGWVNLEHASSLKVVPSGMDKHCVQAAVQGELHNIGEFDSPKEADDFLHKLIEGD
jgi:hypothetical protein